MFAERRPQVRRQVACDVRAERCGSADDVKLAIDGEAHNDGLRARAGTNHGPGDYVAGAAVLHLQPYLHHGVRLR
ncbi:hypothetical protein GCM10009749_29380 [Agromyces neolithicus]|uniref:Uncharacterized protein n=1 Tax=Agromyces neolithicus TaxID=269420 RepID=A0ABN2MAL4_9MICO